MYNSNMGSSTVKNPLSNEEYINRNCRCNCEIQQIRSEETSQGSCGYGIESPFGLVGYQLASVYSPLQNFTDIYEPETSLIRGTIFSQLDLPFICGGMTGGIIREQRM